MIRLNRSKESQYIFGVAEFVVAQNLLLPNLLFVDNVGILCYVSPICQSLRSAHSMDSTGNGGSRSKVLRNLHIVRHQVPHLIRYVKTLYDCIARAISVLKDAPNKKRGNMGISTPQSCKNVKNQHQPIFGPKKLAPKRAIYDIFKFATKQRKCLLCTGANSTGASSTGTSTGACTGASSTGASSTGAGSTGASTSALLVVQLQCYQISVLWYK